MNQYVKQSKNTDTKIKKYDKYRKKTHENKV